MRGLGISRIMHSSMHSTVMSINTGLWFLDVKGTGGGPGSNFWIFFILTYLKILNMRVQELFTEFKKTKRRRNTEFAKFAPFCRFSSIIGENGQKVAWKSLGVPNFSALVNPNAPIFVLQNSRKWPKFVVKNISKSFFEFRKKFLNPHTSNFKIC